MEKILNRVAYYSSHADELVYLMQMRKEFKQFKPSELRLDDLSSQRNDEDYCYEALKKVSRSFSVVIQQLPKELRNPVCLFYLILRGLDTIEDDMKLDEATKKELLLKFSDDINLKEFNLKNIGDTQDYQDLMLHFDKVIRAYRHLDSGYRTVITEITKEMAIGMEKYANRSIVSYADWDDYCHYVAGLVGIGLSQLFLNSGIESSENLADEELSNEMGLFLQKTNIIRDFAEDLEEGRVFWPEASWKHKTTSISQLQQEENNGISALNEMIINALTHVPACLKYLRSLTNKDVFRFCAIPQLMAIATLKKLYNNPDVLHKNIKIHRGRTAKYFIAIQNYSNTEREFVSILKHLEKKDATGKIKSILDSL